MNATPSRPRAPRLVDPALAARVPGLRRVAAVAVLLAALSAVAIVAQAVALAHVVDRSLLHHAPLSSVVPALVLVGVALLVRAVLHAAGDLSALGAADRVVGQLRHDLLRHTFDLGPSWLAGERTGELSLAATRGMRALHAYYFRYLPQAAAAAVIPFLLLVWVATQDWLSLLVVIVLVIAVPLTMIYFGREATRRAERQWRRLSSLSARFLLLVEGLPTLRAFGRELQGRREVEAANDGVRSATMRTLRIAFLSALSMDMIAGFGVGFVAMVLGLRLLWGQLGLETAMAVLLVAPEIFIPLRRAGAEFHASTEGQAAADRVIEVLDTTPAATPIERPSKASTTSDALDISGLVVEYEHRDRPALASFSMHVPHGARVALTGPSGSGKSTLFAALLGLVAPTAGVVTVGEWVLGADPSWRDHFSWLPQRPHLFNASLAENLRLGAPEASDDELRAVLDAVGLTDLIAGLPTGLQTAVGHDGLTLSAGERQRVALARALLRPAPVLLLDEPTAALDPPTVARLAGGLEPWLAARTVVVAAHEPSLLPSFDVLVALSPVEPMPVS